MLETTLLLPRNRMLDSLFKVIFYGNLNNHHSFDSFVLMRRLGRRKKLMEKIHSDYIQNGKYQMTRAEQKNIMLIGRARTGKSTIQSHK